MQRKKKRTGGDLPADSLGRLVQRSLAGRPTEADDIRVPKDGVHVSLEPRFRLGIYFEGFMVVKVGFLMGVQNSAY